MRVTLIFFFCFCVLAGPLFAQSSALGLPFIQNYPPRAYGQGTQNFAVVQDHLGVIYFGNNHGVMTFDGHTWGLTEVANKSEVHSLAVDQNGRIFVGAQGDFGYLQPNPATQHLEFVSLLHLLADSLRNFNDVWNIYCTGHGTIFRSTTGIYTLHEGKLHASALASSNHRSFLVAGELWVREENFGLRRYANGSFEALPGGNLFMHEQIYSIFPYDQKRVLIVAEKQGLLLYDGQRFAPLNSPANDLIRNQPVNGRQLADGSYALGTRFQGLIIIDAAGRILHHISRQEGLVDESVWGVCEDRYTGNLWVATNNGISFVEINSPFKTFQATRGLEGQAYSVIEHRGDLYSVGSLGVFVLRAAAGEKRFKPIPELREQSWHAFSDGSSLLVSTNSGIFEVTENKRPRNIGYAGRAWHLLPLGPGQVLANTPEGLLTLEKHNGRYRVARKFARPPSSLYWFARDERGNIWADSPIRGVFRMSIPNDESDVVPTVLYNKQRGFPSDFKIFPFQAGKEVRFGTEAGIYRYDANLDSIVFDQELNEKVFGAERPNIERMYQDSFGNLWFVLRIVRNETLIEVGGFSIRQTNGTYRTDVNLLWRVQNQKIRNFLTLDSLVTIIATSEGLVSFNRRKAITRGFPVVIKAITLTRRNEHLAMGSEQLMAIPFEKGGIRFSYAGMAFSGVPHLYQAYLEGFETADPGWGEAHSTEYTRLPAGNYVFSIRARNAYNMESDTISIPFEITPPWFLTRLAFGGYALVLIGLVVALVQYRSYALVKMNKRLEAVIEERTADLQKQNLAIHQKNRELEIQKMEIENQQEHIKKKNAELEAAKNTIHLKNDELLAINNQLESAVAERTKELENAYRNLLETKNELDTLIYRSSHDIKGPLLRLLGVCNVALLDVKEEVAVNYLTMLRKEIKNTNKILNKLIVFHYVKSAEVSNTRVNLYQAVQKVIADLTREGLSSEIRFEFRSLDTELEADSYLLGVTLSCLIENAIDFRKEADAQIIVEARRRNDLIEILVADNGRGISREASGRIFEMFFRGSESSSGAGLGLFIARQAVRKMGGDLSFQMLEFTTFMARLPLAESRA